MDEPLQVLIVDCDTQVNYFLVKEDATSALQYLTDETQQAATRLYHWDGFRIITLIARKLTKEQRSTFRRYFYVSDADGSLNSEFKVKHMPAKARGVDTDKVPKHILRKAIIQGALGNPKWFSRSYPTNVEGEV